MNADNLIYSKVIQSDLTTLEFLNNNKFYTQTSKNDITQTIPYFGDICIINTLKKMNYFKIHFPQEVQLQWTLNI